MSPAKLILELTGIKLMPAEAKHLVCADCGQALELAQTMWCCGRGHGRLIPPATIFCRLTGLSEMRITGAHEGLAELMRKHRTEFARRHVGITPEVLLRKITKAQTKNAEVASK